MSKKRNKGKKDLVVGLGATGLSIARYLKRNDASAIFYDSREEPPGLDALEELWPGAEVLPADAEFPNDIRRVVVSPGVADSNPILQVAYERKLEVISDIELFARDADKPFVAVTGSNGKSTVTTLVFQMCRADGRETLAGGNLGDPALDLLDADAPDLYVLELSSFQLQRTASLPAQVAVLLNVSLDHLDWHADEAEYRRAKYRVFREAQDAVINRDDEKAAEAAARCGRVLSFGLDEPGENQYGIRHEDDKRYLARGDMLLLNVDDLALFGVHNQLNALAALAAGDLLGVELSAMLQVLIEFP